MAQKQLHFRAEARRKILRGATALTEAPEKSAERQAAREMAAA